ncbi:MAG: hypothetical protein JXQ75_23615, partial [Phycisphaerae bacterium]|nr:hypothetical protein [Phycisphaerae bacterium]
MPQFSCGRRPRCATDVLRRAVPHLVLCLILLLACSTTVADDSDDTKDKKDKAGDLAEMRPTEIGIRFTPGMARAAAKQFTMAMKPRYDLDDNQTSEIQQIISREFMTFVTNNAEIGRDLIETMIETGIENNGGFSTESARGFGKMAKPLFPALRSFFAETSAKIGKKMTVKQRLKFTVDVTAATAGIAVFEGRMKRWEEGKAPDNANPFWDPPEGSPSAESQPADPNETPEHRSARQNIEQWIDRQINIDERWEGYVDQAIEYYGLNEPQVTAAKVILKDCQERAKRIKTPEWRAAILENRIARRLSWGLGEEVAQGPWMFKLEAEYENLLKPMTDLEAELKHRIEDLPTSEQRAAAKATVRKA